MKAKLHLRRTSKGGYYVQGYIPADSLNIHEFPEYFDCIAAADVFLVIVEDREKEYEGKSNRLIAQEGFP